MIKLPKGAIEVGEYYVTRRGDRVVVLTKKYKTVFNSLGYTHDVHDGYDVMTVFAAEKGLGLTGLPAKEKRNKLKSKALHVKVREIDKKLSAQQKQFGKQLKQLQDASGSKPINGFEVLVTRSGGIKFGCTRVSPDKLSAIRKLLK